MKAGVYPGDYLLQVNGIDVRQVPHDQVLDLIKSFGDTVTFKVITVNPNCQYLDNVSLTMPSISRSGITSDVLCNHCAAACCSALLNQNFAVTLLLNSISAISGMH
ncbi:unnamed protein product [Gongylonema pulchrum]|uniref:PDZ domain-containing protein n=1 Tax=Gongylonema pulchrum TaxID=637853 RepID=A0A183DJR5_9BILA|nr:unnamed protein product [Gongylonema pulchrum]